jgi:hypothetical protein
MLLLKAMKTTQDPKKLAQMSGIRTVAEVFRTLDKMAMRREFHRAFERLEIDFDFILKGIKEECTGASKASDRLKAYQILLRSLGMDSYKEKVTEGGGGWEEALQKISTKENGQEQLSLPVAEQEEYEVERPEIPDSVKQKRDLENKEGKGLYD